MGILWNSISENSNGGTELLCRRLEADLPKELLDEVQIVPSRLYGELDETKVRILYLHDLPNDPESQKILSNQGWKKFHKLVFVSNWQMQQYIMMYQIPWSHCLVIQNSIDPIQRNTPAFSKDGHPKFIYHTTPHRGLDIVYPVFDKLSQEYPGIHLSVYSSFKAYGWDERDAHYKELFDKIDDHPAMSYYGFQPNDVVRKALADSDVFIYPSIWPETSCLALMEAMSAGVLCIHPNLAALYETAANWTMMYQFHEDKEKHAGLLYNVVNGFLGSYKEMFITQTQNQKSYADIFYNRKFRKHQWEDLIRSLLPLPREFPAPVFSYRV